MSRLVDEQQCSGLAANQSLTNVDNRGVTIVKMGGQKSMRDSFKNTTKVNTKKRV